jgi:hypothetical protein
MPEQLHASPADQAESQPAQPFQPRVEFQLKAVQEELNGAINNKLYLVATIKDIEQQYNALNGQFREAQEMWELERQSLLKRISDLEGLPQDVAAGPEDASQG